MRWARHLGWLLLLAIGGCSWLGFGTSRNEPSNDRLPLKRCEDLLDLRVVARDIGLPTLGARVDKADRLPELAPYVDPDGEHLLPTHTRAASCKAASCR